VLIVATGAWWPSLNPVGAWSLTAVLVSAATWILVDRCVVRNPRGQAWLTVIAPLLLLAFVFYSKVHVDASPLGLAYGWRNWRFHAPDAQDFLADYIFIVVALILAWKGVRLPFRDLRAISAIAIVSALAFLTLELRLLYRDLYAGY